MRCQLKILADGRMYGRPLVHVKGISSPVSLVSGYTKPVVNRYNKYGINKPNK